MSWLRTAFNICMQDAQAYYTVLDPIEFYEWRFVNNAPKGHVFTHKLPPSDVFTEGKVIASAIVTESSLKPSKSGYVLKEDSPVDVKIRVGRMPSPQELMDRYHELRRTRDRSMEAFKENLLTRLYVDSKTDNPHLFRISHYTDEDVTMHNFGSIKDLTEQFALVREALIEESMDKTGRAYEMEEFRRYENAMVFTNNSHLHVDSSKLDRLIETSGVKALQTRTLPWTECFLDISPGARQLDERIKYYEDQTWVKSILATSA